MSYLIVFNLTICFFVLYMHFFWMFHVFFQFPKVPMKWKKEMSKRL